MFNVIRMELHRMFRTRSFYITLAVNVILIVLLFSMMASSINEGFAAAPPAAENSVTQNVEGLEMEMVLDNRYGPNPMNVCFSFTGWSILFVVIFMACFVGRFYKDGFCKNVMGSRGYRFRFQTNSSIGLRRPLLSCQYYTDGNSFTADGKSADSVLHLCLS